ncbi:MAG: hypothetical protein K2O69_01420 [Odoribacter sp.]|nr:hypothetical protein [Odoribacter sp.]
MCVRVFKRYFERNDVRFVLPFGEDTEVIVIIPVLNDPDIFRTVNNLAHCSLAEGSAGVVIFVNHSEACDETTREANLRLVAELRDYTNRFAAMAPAIRFYVAEAFDLPAKFAGVGLARKLAMDAAAHCFYRHGHAGRPILSLDADTDVEVNYLDETIRFFRENPVAGVSIAYTHRWQECSGETARAMIRYELYLRYYQVALRYAGHPYAYPCIGSAFAVRASDYVAQGGMNRRQAGEDFYFLQKLIATGRYALLRTTTVHPSARFSERTPFGTGQSVRRIVEEGGSFPVYHPQAFRDLRRFFAEVPDFYGMGEPAVCACFAAQSEALRAYLKETDVYAIVKEVQENCASGKQFARRFFDNFNAFRVLKFLNYTHEHFYVKIEIEEAVAVLLSWLGVAPAATDVENLEILANLD